MQLTALAPKKSLELKKHVGLIHSTNKLSLLERKIANALLYNAYENLQAQNEHTVHIPTLCVLIGYNSNDYRTIKDSLISLISTVIEWNLVDKNQSEGEGVWIASAMLADAKIEGPICTYSYSNRLRELCYHPEFYGRLNMRVLALFKSTYGLALYENCIRYQNISQTPWFDMFTYRKLMGVGDGKYALFRDLKKRVINPSINEVNRYSPIKVEIETKKHGRNVIAIRFLISKQNEASIALSFEQNEKDLTISDRLKRDYGYSHIQIEKVLNDYNEAYLLEKMKLIESSASFRSGKIRHLSKYLEKALLEDYQSPKSSKEHLERFHLTNEKEASKGKCNELYIEQYRTYQYEKLFGLYDKLSEKRKKMIVNSFTKHISTTLYHNIFIKNGFGDQLVRDKFSDFLKENYPDLLMQLISFEKFCKTTGSNELN